jgi:hypothetical protein
MRKARRSIRSEVEELTQEVQDWTGWEVSTNCRHKPNPEGRSLAELFCVHRHIAVFPFSREVAVMETTFETNHFNIWLWQSSFPIATWIIAYSHSATF